MKSKKEKEGVALDAQLVGIKNLKLTHNWRLEFDVFDTSSDKIKELFDLIEQPVSMGIIPHE